VNVILLLELSLPSRGWLLAGLHLLTHPLHHDLHPNRWLSVVLIIFHLLRPFRVQIAAEVVVAEMPGAKMHETKGLDIEDLDALVLASMELGKEPDTMESNAGSEV
jgi:hypothetical protein